MVLRYDEQRLILSLIEILPPLPEEKQHAVCSLKERIVEHLADENDPRCETFRAAADRLWGREGEIEFDPGAVVSEGEDDGAYIQGWVWVSCEEAGLAPRSGEEEELAEVAR